MNKCVIVGNLARDPEARQTPSGVSCCTFTVAVSRRFVNQQGVREADFINCIAWRGTADFVVRYFSKGMKIGLEGMIQTRSYDAQDGTKRYVTEVMAESVEFVGPKQGGQVPIPDEPTDGRGVPPQDQQTGFTEVQDDEMPF